MKIIQKLENRKTQREQMLESERSLKLFMEEEKLSETSVIDLLWYSSMCYTAVIKLTKGGQSDGIELVQNRKSAGTDER